MATKMKTSAVSPNPSRKEMQLPRARVAIARKGRKMPAHALPLALQEQHERIYRQGRFTASRQALRDEAVEVFGSTPLRIRGH